MLVIFSFFVVIENLQVPAKQTSHVPFVGIETGWNSNVTDIKTLIDKVKGYTNLLIIASPFILSDEASLNQTCDYAFKAGLYFMPAYYQKTNAPINSKSNPYVPDAWFTGARERYGDHLLGTYFYDEPGGLQLDETVNFTLNNAYNTTSPTSYLDYANWYFHVWEQGDNGIQAAADFTHSLGASLFTSDYALYWFDYQLGYDTVLAQFGWNNSRPLQIALARGAANVQNKTWGAIITWTYNQTPYLETGPQLYSDMVLAYNSGAKYIAIYDSSQNYTGTTLTKDHYNALKNFWSYMQQNPNKNGVYEADIAVVLPQDYGFGFRSPSDSVWQYHSSDNWTQKLFFDITSYLNTHLSTVDVVYNDQEFQSAIQNKYRTVLNWPKDFKSNTTYQIIDISNGLGYNTVQDAIYSYATYQGDTILVQPATYEENFEVTKPFVLTSQTNESTVISGSGYSISLTIASGHIAVIKS